MIKSKLCVFVQVEIDTACCCSILCLFYCYRVLVPDHFVFPLCASFGVQCVHSISGSTRRLSKDYNRWWWFWWSCRGEKQSGQGL